VAVPFPVKLVEFAEREFPKLMKHRANREDALQTLHLVEHATKGKGAEDAARHALAWLEYELNVVPRPPVCPKPWFYPGEGEPTAQDRAIENEYILRVLVSGRQKYERRKRFAA